MAGAFSDDPAPIPDGAIITQRQIVEGSSIQWRFVLDEAPPATARAVMPTLADAYFHALNDDEAAA